MSKQDQYIKLVYKPTGEVIAEGPRGWGMFEFEGNVYISKKYVSTNGFKFSGIPGICPYKFIYFWYHFIDATGNKSPMLGWKYWLPNPLFPFIAFRIGIPKNHPQIAIERTWSSQPPAKHSEIFTDKELISNTVCPNCWGEQEYDGIVRELIEDKQIDVNNHESRHAFIQEFIKSHIDGIHLQKGDNGMSCNRCKTVISKT